MKDIPLRYAKSFLLFNVRRSTVCGGASALSKSMKYRLTLFLCLLLVSSHAANAQEPRAAAIGIGPEIRAGIGLAYLDFDLAPSARQGLLGLESQMSMNLSHNFGAEIQVGYFRASNVFGSGHHSDILTYLAGPVWYPTSHGFEPYVHALVGLARVTGPVPIATNQFDYGMAHKLAWDLGAGMELRVHGPIRLRIGADYLHSAYFNPLLEIRGQNNLSITASIEYVFGIYRKR
jgi:opacity protein-like surface antigen